MSTTKCYRCGTVYDQGIRTPTCPTCAFRDENLRLGEKQVAIAQQQASNAERAAAAAEKSAEAQQAFAEEQRRLALEEHRRHSQYDAAAGKLHHCMVEVELLEDEPHEKEPHAKLLEVKRIESVATTISADEVDPSQRQDLARLHAQLLKLRKKLVGLLGDDAAALDTWPALCAERQKRYAFVSNTLTAIAQGRTSRGTAVPVAQSLQEAQAQLAELTAYHQSWASQVPLPLSDADATLFEKMLRTSHSSPEGTVFGNLGPAAPTIEDAVGPAEAGYRQLNTRAANTSDAILEYLVGMIVGDKKRLRSVRDVGWLRHLWLHRLAVLEQELQDTTRSVEVFHEWESWIAGEQTGALLESYEKRWPHLKRPVDELASAL
jgi:hypothetical protein